MIHEKISDVAAGYDLVADEYARRLSDELQHKPLDCRLLDRFAESVREIAGIEGLPDYPFVVIDHPIAGNPIEELQDKAARALAAIVARLTVRKT